MNVEFYGFDWIGEFLAADLEDAAREIRFRANQHAEFLEGKARLLREQMRAAQAWGDENGVRWSE